MQTRYYFDHNATTPLREEVMDAMLQAMRDVPGNASSIHHFGQAAKQKMETARRQVAAMLSADPKEIVFTSGGTESDNLALFGSPAGHVITTTIEHPAVLNPGKTFAPVTFIRPNAAGRIDPDDVKRALRHDTTIVSVMHANNETGVVQPVEEIAAIVRAAGVRFHSDGVQAAGKLPRPDCDLYSVSGHKLFGPKGVGALYVRDGTSLRARILGGRHERERRAGTENVPGIIAFGVAASLAYPAIAPLRDRLESGILSALPDVFVNGDTRHRLPNTTNLRFEGVEGEALVIALDLRGFAASSGSACSSGAVEPSHVLLAMGLTPQQARSSVRFSLGIGNTESQVDALIEEVTDAIRHLRRVSATYSHDR